MSSEYFDTWPKTTRTKDGYEIEAWHRTPWTVKIADWVSPLIGIFSGIPIFFALVNRGDGFGGILSGLIIGGIAYVLGRIGLRLYLKRPTIISFSPGYIKIGEKTIDVSRLENFEKILHTKATDEEIAAQEKIHRGKLKDWEINLQRYYRNSFHIYANASGKRILIANVFGETDAKDFITRIHGLCELINNPREWAAWDYDKNNIREESREKTEDEQRKIFRDIIALPMFAVFFLATYLIKIAIKAPIDFIHREYLSHLGIEDSRYILYPTFILLVMLVFYLVIYFNLEEKLWKLWKAYKSNQLSIKETLKSFEKMIYIFSGALIVQIVVLAIFVDVEIRKHIMPWLILTSLVIAVEWVRPSKKTKETEQLEPIIKLNRNSEDHQQSNNDAEGDFKRKQRARERERRRNENQRK